MNYLRTELLNALTERYVIGTMSWRARRRFDRVVDERFEAQAKVYELERSLSPALWALPQVMPSQLIWHRIRRDINFDRHSSPPQRRAWPQIAAALALALIATTLGWWQSSRIPPETIVETITEPVPVEPAVAVINNEDGRTLWVALVYDDLRQARIEVSTAPTVHPDSDYELWAIGEDGVPVSMGLLPQSGEAALDLNDDAINALASASLLAVSLEPLGGSPQPVPSGPVLYTAALMAP